MVKSFHHVKVIAQLALPHLFLELREPFTRDAWSRMSRFPNYRMLTSRPWQRLGVADGRIAIDTPQGRALADFIIAGTGIEVDHRLRPELAHFAEHMATWNDCFKPPPGEENPPRARSLPLSVLRVRRAGTGRCPGAEQHPLLRFRRDAELRPERRRHSPDEISGPQARARAHARSLPRRHRGPLAEAFRISAGLILTDFRKGLVRRSEGAQGASGKSHCSQMVSHCFTARMAG
jgi:hypothetical protein